MRTTVILHVSLDGVSARTIVTMPVCGRVVVVIGSLRGLELKHRFLSSSSCLRSRSRDGNSGCAGIGVDGVRLADLSVLKAEDLFGLPLRGVMGVRGVVGVREDDDTGIPLVGICVMLVGVVGMEVLE